MALTLRLQRHGSTHRPFYHIVATDSRNARDGKFIEKLGYYDPNANPSIMEVKEDRVQYWYANGAQVSSTVMSILRRKNVNLDRKLASTNA
ncbi:MAG: 30S ribosomal protein S16 [Oligoflexus sp.]